MGQGDGIGCQYAAMKWQYWVSPAAGPSASHARARPGPGCCSPSSDTDYAYHYARQHTSPQQAWLRDQIREVLQERVGAPAAQPA
ncbi:hypothetical protein CEY09_16985 [Achromobacter marplatensis]|nr:hypothetical protein CEY09_16985 [Achromobacter marplatensis]